MTPTTPAPPAPSASDASDRPAFGRVKPQRHPLYELTKPGIAGFVMITAGVSAHVAAGGHPELWPMVHTLLGTGLATGGALALNQYIERDFDARMRRTRDRPIPSGRITPGHALIFGLALLTIGVAWLALTVGWIPAGFTVLSALAYLFAYTPLKRRTYLATIVGAVPGALPALIGWTAAGADPGLGAWLLFGIFFLWQLPHVLALAWLLRDDYKAVGFFLMPPSDPDGQRIGRHMAYHSLSLLALSIVPSILGLTGWIYGAGAALLGLGMLATSIGAARDMSFPLVKRVFFASLLYQPLILILMLIDTNPLP
jgi:protoheme IX farnesyltransferase